MRILLSGASGFIGTPLSLFLVSQGHQVVPLVRRSQPGSITWDPEEGKARKEDFEDFDAVIHLAGEPLTLSRWSTAKKKKILHSRTLGTMFLSHLLSLAYRPPSIFLSASAVGYYGDRGEELLTEESPPGAGFLPNVCCAWEKSSFAIQNRGARTIQTRFGLVLGPHGGILQKILPLYKLGLGAILGSGRQWVSWIALEDLIRAIDHILHDPALEGPVNFASPNPIRQKDFSHTLAELLHRPCFLTIPSWALRLGFGTSVQELLLASARVQPSKLLASNFAFNYSDLRSALLKAVQTL